MEMEITSRMSSGQKGLLILVSSVGKGAGVTAETPAGKPQSTPQIFL
jgi:hypothetical protein